MAKYKAYPEYKDSGVEWLGEIPIHWNRTALKRLCSLTTGLTPPTHREDYYAEEGHPWIRPEDLNEHGLYTYATKYVSDTGWNLLRHIKPNSTLVCCIGTIGKCGYVEQTVSTNQQVTAATFHNSGRYYFYVFKASRTQLEELATGNVLKILNCERLGSLSVVKVDHKEADSIAKFLDYETIKIDNLIEKQLQLIELLKEKRQAMISHAVTKGLDPDVPMKDSGVEWLGQVPTHWSISKVRYCFLFDKGLTITKENLQDEGIPCINYGEIHSKHGFEINPNIHKLKYVNETHLKNDKNSLLIKGDIIFADTSEDVDGSGNFSQLTTDSSIFAGYHTIIARPIDRQNYRFLAYLFDCQELRSQIKHAVKGVKVFSITQAILRGLSIWLPPTNEQESISKLLDYQTAKIDTLIQKQRQQIDLLKERRTALIAAAVTGKIDLRDWTPPASSTEASFTTEEATA
ncbi:restriction endonuclease subunit S [Enterobacter bugandensis]|uniref:restriction endonuclease subunit S n=1 Tax=Enterobacter bugandensis TaxID=881260 RepID=UPI0018A487EA|nr:restriction endonuclease subunit S [Enterobacter bugandensis]EKS7115849.1 restriction endonuclease subunit S [Enterobacter bugandensis]MBG0678219.1 restriction endonuclease subunit S [Enterobacter bugandensis]MCK6962814.1 restriction endonuclease subunit S [Enterobacter bugandensis]MCM7633698.1 restriction endonuclease subunit S [Enterobacter bugandensis]BBW25397.1 restriction modification system DNA specificity domain-containing protein [Enterobacter bugandensis]